jgi:hypothetical protein
VTQVIPTDRLASGTDSERPLVVGDHGRQLPDDVLPAAPFECMFLRELKRRRVGVFAFEKEEELSSLR